MSDLGGIITAEDMLPGEIEGLVVLPLERPEWKEES